MSTYQQKELGWMVYPASEWRKLMFKMPLIWWRLGLGRLLSRLFLVLTTRGRKSGLPRHTMLEYSIVDGKTYVVSGWGTRAGWYKNIQADPHVTIQTIDGTQSVVARRVIDEEVIARLYAYAQRSPLWESYLTSLDIQPTREDFVAKKERLVILTFDPTDEPTPAPLEADLVWLWPVMAGCLLVGWFMERLAPTTLQPLRGNAIIIVAPPSN